MTTKPQSSVDHRKEDANSKAALLLPNVKNNSRSTQVNSSQNEKKAHKTTMNEFRHLSMTEPNNNKNKVTQLQEQEAKYHQKIEEEYKRLDDINLEIQKLEKKIIQNVKEIGDHDNRRKILDHKDALNKYQKTFKIIDLQVKQKHEEHNKLLADNNRLVNEINVIRKEKTLLQNMLNQIANDQEKQEEKMKIIEKEVEKQERNEIEECKKLLGSIKDLELEKKNMLRKSQKFLDILDEDRKKYATANSNTKNPFATFSSLHGLRTQSQNFNRKLFGKTAQDNSFREDNLLNPNKEMSKTMVDPFMRKKSRRFKDTAQILQKLQEEHQENEREIAEYDRIFKNLREKTGLVDMEKIKECFIEKEKDNQSLFTFVSALTADKESLEHRIMETKRAIEIEESKSKIGRLGDEKGKQISELKKQQSIVEAKRKEIEKVNSQFQKILKSLKVGLPNIFERIGCDIEDDTLIGISDSNILKYMAIIERRTNEILQMYEICQTKGVNDLKDKKNSDESGLNFEPSSTITKIIEEHYFKELERDKEKDKDNVNEDKKTYEEFKTLALEKVEELNKKKGKKKGKPQKKTMIQCNLREKNDL